MNAQTPGGVAPLHRAAYCGHTEVVQLLLQHKANVMVTDSDGRTPLHKVCRTASANNPFSASYDIGGKVATRKYFGAFV